MNLLLEKKAFAHLATVMPDGSPQNTPVWFDFAGGKVRVNSALGRTKVRNLTPIAYAARNASGPQQPGALRSTTGFAPQAVATPDQTGPNDERILLSTG